MVPNDVYGKPDLCEDWFEESVLTRPLAMRGLMRNMSSKWFIKWQVLSSWTIKYCTSKFELIILFNLRTNTSNSSVSLVLALLKY